MACSKASSIVSLKKTIKDYKCLEILKADNEKVDVLCQICCKSFTVSKSNHPVDHIDGSKHRKCVSLQKQRQAVFVPSGRRQEDDFNILLTEAWIGAGLPIKALANDKLKRFLETNFKRSIPSTNSLYYNYAEKTFKNKFEKLKEMARSWDYFYLTFDECDHSGSKYYAILIGQLDGTGPHSPYLLAITKESTSPNSEIVQQKVVQALSTLGTLDFCKFRLFVTDNASYNPAAAAGLNVLFTKMIHLTCVTHMTARVSSSILDANPEVNELVKNIKKVFEKSPMRVNTYISYDGKQLPKFPLPMITRWGTWLNAACYISKYWNDLKNYLATIRPSESSAAAKAVKLMREEGILKAIGEVAALGFLSDYIKLTEISGYTAVNADNNIQDVCEKLNVLSNTGNSSAKIALDKFFNVLEKNKGFKLVVAKARGENISDPQEIQIYAFAPCTSVDIERFFSILNNFLSDRCNISESTLNKLLFVQYNCNL